MVDVVVAGHLCVDIIPSIPAGAASSGHLLAPGRLTEVGKAIVSTGGAVANTGVALYRLGMRVRLVGLVGTDAIGKLTRDVLSAYDPELVRDLITSDGEPSSYTLVFAPPERDRAFLHCPGTNNAFGPDDVPTELLAATRVLHVGYPPVMRRMYESGGQGLAALLSRAKAEGATTSLDMCMPDPLGASGAADWRTVLRHALPLVDLFEPSVEELLFMLHRERFGDCERRLRGRDMVDLLDAGEIRELAQEALEMGCKIVMLKLGHRGVYVLTASTLLDMGRGSPEPREAWCSRELWAPCFSVDVVGTTGAGDATIAGFLTGVLKGLGPEPALTGAVAVGACNVEALDATSGIRSWDETQARVSKGWPKLEPDIGEPGWVWDEEHLVWIGPSDGLRSSA